MTNQKVMSVHELAETIRQQRRIALIANLKALAALGKIGEVAVLVK
jgi:hypothetical protein